jgi:hypothetical protein
VARREARDRRVARRFVVLRKSRSRQAQSISAASKRAHTSSVGWKHTSSSRASEMRTSAPSEPAIFVACCALDADLRSQRRSTGRSLAPAPDNTALRERTR